MSLDRLSAALSDRYTIERELGQGGMATVYLAADLKHDRKVAIKVLRPELAAVIGAERFLSEIKTTANLQHPHILPLFDSGAANSFLFYVMPFVEGETLRERISREKQLPIGDAVRVASEVASALDYAHRHGVIHRDIKPENILLHDGRALVADFGIALAASSAGSRMTETGMSLGTPHYMSPEQAMGERELDARTDVYALGAVLYEMLTGDPPFTGSTAQAIVAKVVTEKPVPPSKARDTIPEAVEDTVLAALQKLPADRPASAAAFGEMLVGAGATTVGRRATHRRPSPATRLPWLVAATATLALAVQLWQRVSGGQVESTEVRPSKLALMAPGLGNTASALLRQIAITPDGSTVYYIGQIGTAQGATIRQRLDEEEPTQVTSIEANFASYRISPDGTALFGIRAIDGTAHRIQLTGGGGMRPVPGSPDERGYAAWAPDGSLWLSVRRGDIKVIHITADDRVEPLPGENKNLRLMQALDAQTLLAVEAPPGTNSGPVVLVDTETGLATSLYSRPVVEARYTSGYLVYVLQTGEMEAVAVDRDDWVVTGPPTQVATGVSVTGSGVAQFDVATDGTVVYLPEEPRSLMLVDRAGAERLATTERHNFHSPRFSADGGRLLFDFSGKDGRDVSMLDLAPKQMSKVTFESGPHDAAWMPNGSISYVTVPPGGDMELHTVRPGGTELPDSLFGAPELTWAGDWFADGKALLAVTQNMRPGSGSDVAILRGGGRGPLEALVATGAAERYPTLSPDNRWLAYTSDKSGREEVYLGRLDGTGDLVQVSRSGGVEPVWSRDGRELFYMTIGADRQLVSARLAFTPAGAAVVDHTPLFSTGSYAGTNPHSNYDVSPNRDFAMVRTNPSVRIMVIQNLPGLVRQLRGEAP